MSEVISENKTDEAGAGDERGAAMEKQTTQKGESITDDSNSEEGYEKAAFKDLSSHGESSGQLTTTENTNLDVILDIPVTLSMEIGRTELPINNLLQLNQGSVVELDRLAGEPLDVLINGTLIAHGEVVVVNEKFGIRLTDVISPAERVKKLR
ncbi:MAG: flagellar motor switch protein FliN [Thiotrichaceae bacterium]|nr:MAG: flagellar motor switch protein FliN [Thiotrichaceae bacterium]